MLSDLHTLCKLNGVSGDEDRVRDYIRITIGTKEQMDKLLLAIESIEKEWGL